MRHIDSGWRNGWTVNSESVDRRGITSDIIIIDKENELGLHSSGS